MNKYIFVCLLALAINCNSQSIPQADLDLSRGFFEGSGLKTYLNITSCEADFNTFMSYVISTIEDILKKNRIKSAYDIGQVLIHYSGLLSTCPAMKNQIDFITNYSYNVFLDPQIFLEGVVSNMVTFYVAGKYWGLSGKIKSRQFYEVGKVFGEIMAYVINVDIGVNKPLSFLEEKQTSGCLETGKSILYDLMEAFKCLILKDYEQAEILINNTMKHISLLSKLCIKN